MRRGFGKSGRRFDQRACSRTGAAFIDDLPSYACRLRLALRNRNVAWFALACKLIRDFARPLGFESLAAAADDALGSVRRTRCLDHSHEEVALLAMLCDRAAGG